MENTKMIKELSKKLEIVVAKNIETFDDVINAMDRIQKQMLWDKVCSNSDKLDRLNEKMNLILEKLGEK